MSSSHLGHGDHNSQPLGFSNLGSTVGGKYQNGQTMNNGMVSNISNEAMSLKVSESQASHYNNDQKKMLN